MVDFCSFVYTKCLDKFARIHLSLLKFFVHIGTNNMNGGPPLPQVPGFHLGDEPFDPYLAIARFPASYCMKYFCNIFCFLC
jgi:hypothetical protein